MHRDFIPKVSRAANARRSITVFVCVVIWSVAISSMAAGPVYAQSLEVSDGSNAVAFGLYSEVDPEYDLPMIGGYSAFSIAGIMDIGGYFAQTATSVNGTEGNNRSLGFVYNVMPLKQQPEVPVSLQLRLTYGITLVDPDLVYAELLERAELQEDPFDGIANVESTRTHYSLGFGLLREFALGPVFSARLGGDVEYRVTRSTYSALLTRAEEDESLDVAGVRETRLLFGPMAGVSVRHPNGPVFSLSTRFWFDEDAEFVVRPELGLVLVQRN